MEHADGGDGLLVGADLDVSDPGLVVDHGVQERCPDQCAATIAALASAVGHRDSVDITLLSADEPVPATVGDVAELVTSMWIIDPGWSEPRVVRAGQLRLNECLEAMSR